MRIPKFLKNMFGHSRQQEHVPADDHMNPLQAADENNNNNNDQHVIQEQQQQEINQLDNNHVDADDNNVIGNQVPRKKSRNPFKKLLPYCSCIILSISTAAQMVVGHFVRGRAGDNAAEAIDIVGQQAAMNAHEAADEVVDLDFYQNRALLPRAQAHPVIEGYAMYLAQTANYFIGFLNRCTQYVATGRVPISVHDFILGAQVLLLLGSIIGISASTSTTSMIQSLSISSAAYKIVQHHYPPTLVVSEMANIFFDFLSDRIVRPTIYWTADVLEWSLDSVANIGVWGGRVNNGVNNGVQMCIS